LHSQVEMAAIHRSATANRAETSKVRERGERAKSERKRASQRERERDTVGALGDRVERVELHAATVLDAPRAAGLLHALRAGRVIAAGAPARRLLRRFRALTSLRASAVRRGRTVDNGTTVRTTLTQPPAATPHQAHCGTEVHCIQF
jgi:hypothetical protein